MSIQPIIITNKSNIDEVIRRLNQCKSFLGDRKFYEHFRYGNQTKDTLKVSCRDFINVTRPIDEHKFHARKVILAVGIAAAFPQRRGVSAFHRFIERGYLPRQWSLETIGKAECLTISIQP